MPSGRHRASGTCIGAHRGTPGKVGARKSAVSAEREARLPLPPAAPPPALSRRVSARGARTAASPPSARAAWGPRRVRRRALGAPAETLRPADAWRAHIWSPERGTRGPEGVGGVGVAPVPGRHASGRDFGQKIGGGSGGGGREPGAVPGGGRSGSGGEGGRVWSEQVAQFRQPGELAGGVGLACQLVNFKSQFGSAAA